MQKIRIGITGQTGFVGSNLYERLGEHSDKYVRVPFERNYFNNEDQLRYFVRQCDVIIHLAALVRSPKEGAVYDTNILLGNKLINAMIMEDVRPCVMFASSVQEFDDSEYGRCKRDTRDQLSKWASQHNTGFAGLVFPNLFGAKARPNSHSFIATFCYKLTHGEEPQVLIDNNVSLKYIETLLDELLGHIDSLYKEKYNKSIRFQPDFTMKVTEVLETLKEFKETYLVEGQDPILINNQRSFLFDTFKSYINYK